MDGVHSETGELLLAKEALRQFARSRSSLSKEAAEHEFGELLLYIMKLAGRLDIDLVAVCQQELQNLASQSETTGHRAPKSDG